MTKSEIDVLIAETTVAWPRFQATVPTFTLWFEMFRDVPFELARTALRVLMVKTPYPPSIHDLRQAIADLSRPTTEALTAGDAWHLVDQAVDKFGHLQTSRDGLDSLPPKVRRVVEVIGWRDICQSTIQQSSVLRGQFFRVWDEYEDRTRIEALMPAGLRAEVLALSEKLSAPAAIKKVQ
jgi:hypothetical protein